MAHNSPEIRSPEFTGSKIKPELNRSTGLNTISGRINLMAGKKDDGKSVLEVPLQNSGTQKSLFPAEQLKPLYQVEKLFPEAKGVKYEEYRPIEPSVADNTKIGSSLAQSEVPDYKPLSLPGPSLRVFNTIESKLPSSQFVDPMQKENSRFGVVSLAYKGQSDLGMPRFDSYMPMSKKPQQQQPYKFSQVDDPELPWSHQKQVSQSKDEEVQPTYEPERDDWTGFTILKRYASKDRLHPKPVKAETMQGLAQSKSAIKLAQAFFATTTNHKKSNEDQYYTSLADDHGQESVQAKESEFKQKYSRLNTFGRYNSQQTDQWDSPAEKQKVTMQAYLSRPCKDSIPEIVDRKYEETTNNTDFRGLAAKTRAADPATQTFLSSSVRDSYLANLLAKIGAPPPEKSPRSNARREINRDKLEFFNDVLPKDFEKASPRTRFTQREISESQRIISQQQQTPVASHRVPGYHHESHSKKAGVPVATVDRRPGQSSRQIRVNIDSLVQRTLSDLKR